MAIRKFYLFALILFEGNLFSLWNRLKMVSEEKYLVLILKVAFLFILSVDGVPQSTNQFSRFFSSELLNHLNHLINVKFKKICPCLCRFLVKVFSSFEFSFLSGTAGLTTQPLPLLPAPYSLPSSAHFPHLVLWETIFQPWSALLKLRSLGSLESFIFCFLL